VSRRLSVHHAYGRVGLLEQGEGRVFQFTYDEAWLDSPKRFPISLSLPLRGEPHQEAAHPFFSNLLPEGDVRRLLCRRLGISTENDFELLAAIGGECAGALVIASEEAGALTLIHRTHWEATAKSLGLGTRFVLSTVKALIDQFPEAISATVKEFRAKYGEKPALQMVVPKLRRQLKRVARLLA
jgi:HipA-like protein